MIPFWDNLACDLATERVQVEGEGQKGQENAMEMAVTQNTRLLKVPTGKDVWAATATAAE